MVCLPLQVYKQHKQGNLANAPLSSVKKAANAYKCVTDSNPSSDPHFFDSFIETHCDGRIKPADKRACALAKQKMEDGEEEQENEDDDEDE